MTGGTGDAEEEIVEAFRGNVGESMGVEVGGAPSEEEAMSSRRDVAASSLEKLEALKLECMYRM